ncbi:nuclear transport factor 2 family protein [Actinomadura monticuli]|uniref:Nuclear transport factor 2 family protein n=1 Tax=Actinomadura monticuli TaxID=3097367 RepID=A0ABV4QN59_9ACTN
MTAPAAGPLELRAWNAVVHDTADPEVIVAEFDYDGRVTATGRTFRVANLQVLRVRDGLIVETRDYHDHPGLARALRGE